jgi:REP element-mobilizing transposase RayT
LEICPTWKNRAASGAKFHIVEHGTLWYQPVMGDAEVNPKIERVRYELRASGVKAEAPNPLRSGIHSRGYLPHVKREGAVYFVTMRLADSLPKEVLMKFLGEKAERLRRLDIERAHQEKTGKTRPIGDTEEAINRDYYRNVERYLDKGLGECVLNRLEIAAVVAGAIRFFDGQRYRLHAWVVMPNHAHVVFWPMPNQTVSQLVKSWKQYTATRANRILNRVGTTFWQPEPFDHWIRDDEEHARCCRYVLQNPVKARLCAAPEDWQWSSAWPGWKTAPPQT